MIGDPVTREKKILFSRQPSVACITPEQHKPTATSRQTVLSGNPGSWKVTQTLYKPGPENECVGKGRAEPPAMVIVSFLPLAGSPKSQVKKLELLRPSACKTSVMEVQGSPLILISVICPRATRDKKTNKKMKACFKTKVNREDTKQTGNCLGTLPDNYRKQRPGRMIPDTR